MFGLNILDLIVIGVYFAGLISLGIWTKKSIKSTGDYFMGNRRFGKIMMITNALGAGTRTDLAVAVSGACYQIGLAGIWYQWLYIFNTPFYWLLAPIYRRLRYITTGDFFEERYGTKLGAAYAAMGLIYFTLNAGIMFRGTGTAIEAVTKIPSETIIFSLLAVFLAYSVLGGLVSAMVINVIQGIFILILSFLLIPFALHAAGGISEIKSELPAHMFSFVAPTEVTLFFIITIVINSLVGIVVEPHHMSVGGAGKTEINCRTGWTYGNFVKRIATLGWAFVGVFAAALYPGLTSGNREQAFGLAVVNLLPAGLLGLMVAAMAAAVMASCHNFMVAGSALFTRNFYQKYLRKNKDEAHYIKVARLSSVVIVLGGVAFALLLPSVVAGLKIIWQITAFFGIAFWMAVIWRRSNRYAVWGSLIVTILSSLYVGKYFDFGLGLNLAWQITIYLPLGFLSFIIISFFTKPEPKEKLDKFYTLLHTPVGEEYKLKEAGIDMILDGVPVDKIVDEKKERDNLSLEEKGHGLLVVDFLALKKKFSIKRYKIDIYGFAAAVLLVFVIIGIGLFTASLG
jgi:Na+/proline symporter